MKIRFVCLHLNASFSFYNSGPDATMKDFAGIHRASLAKDRDGNPVWMAKSQWDVGYVVDRNPDIRFSATRER